MHNPRAFTPHPAKENIATTPFLGMVLVKILPSTDSKSTLAIQWLLRPVRRIARILLRKILGQFFSAKLTIHTRETFRPLPPQDQRSPIG